MKKILFCLAFICLFSCTAGAEEVYDLVYPYTGGIARVVTEEKWGLIDTEGHTMLSPVWDYIGEQTENRRLVMQNQLFGFIDTENKTVISPVYTQTEPFSEGLACAKNDEGKWGFIDPDGEMVIPFVYDEANSFSDGLALIKKDGLYGYINAENNAVIPCSYEEAYPFHEARACVLQEGLYGYIDTAGKPVIAPQFSLAFDFCEGAAVVKTDAGYGLIDSGGAFLLKPQWEHLSPRLQSGLLKAEKGGRLALIDTNGRARTDFIYEDMGPLAEGLFSVCLDGQYGYIDTEGTVVIAPAWDTAGDFSEGLAPVSREGLFGYIDTKGRLVTELSYQGAARFSAGLAPVQNTEGRWQFIRPASAASAFTEQRADNTLLLQIGRPYMEAGETEIPLEAAPVLEEGVTMLPIRAVVEAIGGQVEWEPEEQKITLRHRSHVVILRLGEGAAFADGRFTILETPPMLKNGRTLVPLRFVLETLQCTVDWEETTREILITYPQTS